MRMILVAAALAASTFSASAGQRTSVRVNVGGATAIAKGGNAINNNSNYSNSTSHATGGAGGMGFGGMGGAGGMGGQGYYSPSYPNYNNYYPTTDCCKG